METGKEVAIKIIENLAENIREVSIEIIMRKTFLTMMTIVENLMQNIKGSWVQNYDDYDLVNSNDC